MKPARPNQAWYLFEIEVDRILAFIEETTGHSYDVCPKGQTEANRWHKALRRGLRTHLHLDVGIPGFDEPDHPVAENESALQAALLLGIPRIKVILSGEWEVAVRTGLISRDQLRHHERAMRATMET